MATESTEEHGKTSINIAVALIIRHCERSEAISPYGISQLEIASSLRSSVTAPALPYLLRPCSRRNDALIRAPLSCYWITACTGMTKDELTISPLIISVFFRGFRGH